MRNVKSNYLNAVLHNVYHRLVCHCSNKTIEFMFVGINMFRARLRIILARVDKRGLKNEL